jgi:CheY-like chemotaxis protein
MSATILVVEDDPDIQDILQAAIHGAGYSVATASNGEEALTRLGQEQQVCLILLDLMMPVMNGFQFLAELVKDPAQARIPVVAVTGAGPSMLTGLPPSIPVLRKPFDYNALLRTIERYRKT